MSPSTTQPWANRMRYSDQWTRRIRYSDQHIRVSDAERNAVAELLGQHYADGRLDQAEFDEVLGTIAGDNTVLVICPDTAKADALRARIEALIG